MAKGGNRSKELDVLRLVFVPTLQRMNATEREEALGRLRASPQGRELVETLLAELASAGPPPPFESDEEFFERAAKAFDSPWESRVGFEGDQNAGVFLVDAPLAAVTAALRPLVVRVETDILGRSLPVVGEWSFVFRLSGHRWTTVLRNALSPKADRAFNKALVALSKDSGRALLSCEVSDTTNSLGYTLVERGRVTESFSAVDGEKPEFQSKRRKVSRAALGDTSGFLHQFLAEQKAYVSSISPHYFFGNQKPRGKKARAVNPGFNLAGPRTQTTVPSFEGVDYLLVAEKAPPSIFG